MLLCFPSLDALKTVLAADAVPREIRRAGAMVTVGPDGRVWLQRHSAEFRFKHLSGQLLFG